MFFGAPANFLEDAVYLLLYFLVAAALVVITLVAVDRHLCLKDLEKDLKEYLGDLLVARDCSEGQVRVHYQATVSGIKSLIRRHFNL